ncbi:transporter substrate-binding domain-containing protein [Duganella sp. CY15W]|uniref:substrate-binding periplasmic protein n=1 Tax=Duganella sp. CY15W TaxID=2692172 RepID=UPI00137152F2|nr:transporter substrate-binding domain-containing protein [Duganella sp. CY15W]MYM28913.1 transporter substrate-binding domain-containing protein [Duganella sp. CY15W]
MRRRAWACALLLAAVAAPSLAARGPLRILGADIAPLYFERNGVVTGFCAEVTREIQRRIGDRTAMQVVPWARAYRTALAGENVILVCPKRTAERDPHFQWIGPVLESRTNLYALRESRIKLATLDDARTLSGILLPRDFYSYQYLQDAGFTNLEPVGSSKTMLNMLLAGRRPAMVVDREQLPELLAQAGIAEETVEPVLFLMNIQSYITFPPDAPASLVGKWQQALEQMKRDGSFAKLQKQWLHR